MRTSTLAREQSDTRSNPPPTTMFQ